MKPSNPVGRFITLEGQDGAGKTTNIHFIEKSLGQYGITPLVTREPGGTDLGEELRKLLLDGHKLEIDPIAELLLIFASRAQHFSRVIKPALESGTWVVCDRFTDATYAYQAGGRGIDTKHVSVLESMVQGEIRPDLTLLLDVEPGTGIVRAQQRRVEPDRFEIEREQFKKRVRATYLERAKAEPERVRVIDASKDLDDVQTRITEIILEFMEKER